MTSQDILAQAMENAGILEAENPIDAPAFTDAEIESVLDEALQHPFIFADLNDSGFERMLELEQELQERKTRKRRPKPDMVRRSRRGLGLEPQEVPVCASPVSVPASSALSASTARQAQREARLRSQYSAEELVRRRRHGRLRRCHDASLLAPTMVSNPLHERFVPQGADSRGFVTRVEASDMVDDVTVIRRPRQVLSRGSGGRFCSPKAAP